MSGKPVLPEHRAWLTTLIDRYGSRRLVKLIEKRKAIPRKSGRPSNYRGNLCLHGYIEFHRKQKNGGGRALGITGACGRLKKLRLSRCGLRPDRGSIARHVLRSKKRVLSR